jgi:hypothetical protein
MTGQIPPRRIEPTVSRLVETLHDKEEAKRALDHFKETAHPPPLPAEFPNLSSFLEFHVKRQRYEKRLKSHEAQLSELEQTYEQLGNRLLGVLPENIPLHYEYAGLRSGLKGAAYTIMNRQGELTVEGSG